MSDRGQTRGLSPYVWGTCLIVLLCGLTWALISDPESDPPLGATDLEGQVLLGARSGLDGSPLGDWRPDLLVPFKTRLDALAFHEFGLSLTTARRVNAGIAILVVALFYLLLATRGRPGTAFLGAVFLATNPVFFGIARTSLPAVVSLFLMLLTIVVWNLGRRSAVFMFLAGASVVLSSVVENGPRNLFFLISGAFMILVVQMHGWRMTWIGVTRRRVRAAVAGGLLVLVALGYAVLTHWQDYGVMWGHFHTWSLHLIATNVVMTPVYVTGMVRLMPLTTILALASFLFYAKEVIRPVARHRELDEVGLWFLAWLLSGVVFFALIAAPPLDALVLLVPPLCAVAAHGVVRLFALRTILHPRLDVMIVMILISISVWFIAAIGVREWFDSHAWTGVIGRHQLRAKFAIILLIWGSGTYLLGWLYLRWRHFTLELRPGPVTALTVALVVATVGMGLRQGVVWWVGRTHEVVAVRELLIGRLPENSLVAGSWAPLLTLGTASRSTVIWAGLNDRPSEWHQELTHLLLQSGREESEDLPPRKLLEGQGIVSKRVTVPATIGPRTVTLYKLDPRSPNSGS